MSFIYIYTYIDTAYIHILQPFSLSSQVWCTCCPLLALCSVWSLLASMAPKQSKPLFQQLRELATPSKVFSWPETLLSHQLAQCCEHYLVQHEAELIAANPGLPIVQHLSADGTPVQMPHATTVSITPNSKKRSTGKSTQEYLLCLCFTRFHAPDGSVQTGVRFNHPIPLTNGKGHHAVFATIRDTFKTLRELGHKGIAIQGYSFDRALFSIHKLFYQLHKYLAPQQSGAEGEPWQLLDLLEWVVATPCAVHDTHNALKWALFMFLMDALLLKDMWQVTASLHNAHDLLVQHLCTWLLSHVTFVSQEDLPSDVHLKMLWTALGLSEDVVNILVELQAIWSPSEGKLLLCSAAKSKEGLMGTLTGCIIAVWKFKLFKEQRWVSQGSNSRTMAAALLLGLQSQVAAVRDDPLASDYHIHGFAKLSPKMLKYIFVCSLSSYVSDALLSSLLEDPRVPSRMDKLLQAMESKLVWLESLDLGVISLMASIADVPSEDLFSDIIKAGHVAASFFDFRVLYKAREPPWVWATGDHEWKMKILLEQDPPTEPVSLKIYKLAKKKWPTPQLYGGLDGLLELPWSIQTAEQSHQALAGIPKLHSQTEAPQVLARAMVTCFSKLLPHSSIDQRKDARLRNNSLLCPTSLITSLPEMHSLKLHVMRPGSTMGMQGATCQPISGS